MCGPRTLWLWAQKRHRRVGRRFHQENEAGHRLQQAATHKKQSTGMAAVWNLLLPYCLFPLDIVSRGKVVGKK